MRPAEAKKGRGGENVPPQPKHGSMMTELLSTFPVEARAIVAKTIAAGTIAALVLRNVTPRRTRAVVMMHAMLCRFFGFVD
jgi:hypothetical protein